MIHDSHDLFLIYFSVAVQTENFNKNLNKALDEISHTQSVVSWINKDD